MNDHNIVHLSEKKSVYIEGRERFRVDSPGRHLNSEINSPPPHLPNLWSHSHMTVIKTIHFAFKKYAIDLKFSLFCGHCGMKCHEIIEKTNDDFIPAYKSMMQIGEPLFSQRAI